MAVAALGLLTGCDGSEDESATAGSAGEAGEGGALVWALDSAPRDVDPLHARSPSEALVSRQVHEPLAASVGAPFDEARLVPGLAISVLPTEGGRVWRVRLREGVRFQDGGSFDTRAVLANARRWQESSIARRLLGDFLVDAPKPGLVRFILPAPDPGFAERLGSARLGILSPRALRRVAILGSLPARATSTGTGPFEIRERGGGRLLLARNTEWWGTDRRLGPAIDQIEFRIVPGAAAERVAMLSDGTAQVASGIGPAHGAEIRSDPLLTVIPGAGGLAAERSVRGISAADGRAPLLNELWRTAIAPG